MPTREPNWAEIRALLSAVRERFDEAYRAAGRLETPFPHTYYGDLLFDTPKPIVDFYQSVENLLKDQTTPYEVLWYKLDLKAELTPPHEGTLT